MRTNRKRNKKRVKLVGIHCAGFALLGLAAAVVCYVIDAQCTMYGNKLRDGEKKLEQLQRELKHEEGKWALMRTPEELRKLMPKHGIEMDLPLPQQVLNVDKPPVGSSDGWIMRYHPETLLAIKSGVSALDFVRSIRNGRKPIKN